MNYSEKLKNLLISLCSTDEDNEILNKLCSFVVKVEDGSVEFEDFEFNYHKNEKIEPNPGLPESFREIAQVATSMLWDGGGPEIGFELTEDGNTTADDWLLGELDEEFAGASGAKAAFLAGQNGLFFDPSRKLANGEPALSFISHEECEWVEVVSMDAYNYKQIFLRMLSDKALETDFIPEIYF